MQSDTATDTLYDITLLLFKMATDIGSETVEEAEAIIGDKGCSTIDTVERKNKSLIWSSSQYIRKTNLKRYV